MSPFSLTFREQQQLFLFDDASVANLILNIGGLSMLVARFIVQFFVTPMLALAVTLILGLLMAFLLWLGIRQDRHDWKTLPLCLIPVIFEFSALSDNAMHYDAFIAMMFAVAAIPLFRKSGNIFVGILYAVVLYAAAGYAAMVFAAVAVIMIAFAGKPFKAAAALAIPAAVAVCAWLSSIAALTPTFGIGFSPRMFYDPSESMHWGHWIPAASVPFVVLVSGLIKFLKNAPAIVFGTVLVIASVFCALRIEPELSEPENAIVHKCEYYSERGDWDNVIKASARFANNEYFGNYLNMALAQKGRLAEDLFKYWQKNPNSLFFNPNNRSSDIRLARVEYAMGNMPAAQVVAFNSLQSSCGLNPSMLKMLTKIELMRGSWKVAEKYLNILGKNWRYHGWAEHYRSFLGSDEAVARDAELSNGKSDFPDASGFVAYVSPFGELLKVIEANPNDSKAVSYGLCFLLLGKDIDGICSFVDRFHDAPALNPLPRLAQEALVFSSAYYSGIRNGSEAARSDIMKPDPEWCLSKGVSQETIDRFAQFQKDAMSNGGHIPAAYRDTFWFYFARVEK
jgi:hypothetical protein